MGATTMTPGRSTANPQGQAPVRPVPFTRASLEHTEAAGVRSSAPLSATTPLQIGPDNIVAFGYMAYIIVRVVASGGDAGAATVAYNADAPFSVIGEITLQDINGTPIYQVSGYEAFLVNTWGGYDAVSQPTLSPAFVAPDTDGNFAYTLRIPVMLRQRDALGSLPNMNAAASYQLKVTQAVSSAVYSTPPDTLPTISIDTTLAAWALPNGASATGQPQAIQPPCVGTTQYWTRQAGQTVVAGRNDIQFTRVGNLIRNVIVVARDENGARSNSVLLDPFELKWDGRIVLSESVAVRKDTMTRRFGVPVNVNPPVNPAGVIVLDWTHSFTGHPGDGDLADLWLATASSSRLELSGNAAAGGSLTFIVNDVIPVGDIFALD